jgi:hypothetical protein
LAQNDWTSKLRKRSFKPVKGIGHHFARFSDVIDRASKIGRAKFAAFPFLIFFCLAIGCLFGQRCLLQYRVERYGTITDGGIYSVQYDQIGRGGGWVVYYIFGTYIQCYSDFLNWKLRGSCG